MKVIGLERGPRLKTADFNPHDELRYFQRQDLRPDAKRQPVTWRPNANARANPMPLHELRQPGRRRHRPLRRGILALARGRFPRPLAHDRALRRRPPSRRIPRFADWPVSYAELEPFYDKAEYELGVSGKAGNLQGRKIDGGNRVRGAAAARISAAAAARWTSRASCSKPAPASSAITRSRRRARSCRSPTRAGPAAPIAASARRSAAMSARSRASSSPSCPRPMRPEISS